MKSDKNVAQNSLSDELDAALMLRLLDALILEQGLSSKILDVDSEQKDDE